MSGDILSLKSILPFLFIIASGYITLLWSYRDANKLDYFYNNLKEFDKATQTTFIGILIYLFGYFVNPDLFSIIFSDVFPTTPEIFSILTTEIILIVLLSIILSQIIKIIHLK